MGLLRRLPLLGVAAIASACSLQVDNPTGQPAIIRVVNAAPGTTSVMAYLNTAGEPLTGALAYRAQTEGCFLILPSRQTVSFVQNDTNLSFATTSFLNDVDYTAILTKSGTTYRALVLADAQAVDAGNNALRFINATGTAGDVYVTAANAAPSASSLARSNLPPVATSTEVPAYVQRPAGDVRVRLYDVGTTATARSDITITAVSADRRLTIVFTTPAGSSDVGAIVVFPCK